MADPVRDFGLTEDGELDVQNGDLVRVAGAAAVPQGIRVRLRMFFGECYLDESVGRQWLEVILVKNPSELAVREELREGIANTPDVTDVSGQALNSLGNREAEIGFVAGTVYQVRVEGPVAVPL